ncbi:MAG TPA: hypothetical protein VLJ38_02785, partial [Polyangiaceae bacterium]|nr:hypothetical protein [Polyangiaceae bacterium]
MDAQLIIAERVRDAIIRAFGADFREAEPAVHRSSFADYQADAALRLAKPLRKPPLEIAQTIAANLDTSGLCPPDGVTVSPPGFVNITLGR